MLDTLAGASVPTVFGLLLIALAVAALGYWLVQGVWRLFLVRQWRKRHLLAPAA